MKCSNCNKDFKVNELFNIFNDGMVFMCEDCAKQFIKNNKHYKRNYLKMYNIIMKGEN